MFSELLGERLEEQTIGILRSEWEDDIEICLRKMCYYV